MSKALMQLLIILFVLTVVLKNNQSHGGPTIPRYKEGDDEDPDNEFVTGGGEIDLEGYDVGAQDEP
uniref:Transmembrane protein n=1 Tax=Medicago truncatula TaxID=3880 RepID=A2Q4D3_MEDTR|nr:hypothetical protein MtrDRAFT_AC157472g11v2 [Medicago truncatula]